MIPPALSTPFQYRPLEQLADNTDSNIPAKNLSRSRRNVAEPAKYWPQNSTLKIATYDWDLDDSYVQAVMKAASHWLPHINLKFEFVTGEVGDVRITQDWSGSGGGSSRIGTDTRDAAPWEATMKLPLDHTDPRFEYVVMHEFGHMLGAHHAHQHPDANIPWNHDKVYDGYRHLANLDKQAVQANVLPLPKNNTYDFLPYDENSVMHYEIRPQMTDGKWGQSESWSLSDGDIAWAKKAYPKKKA